MVQVTFDTTNDTIEELENALELLKKAIQKRAGPINHSTEHEQDISITEIEQMADSINENPAPYAKEPITEKENVAKNKGFENDLESQEENPAEETAIDTPFLKITLKSSHEDNHQQTQAEHNDKKVPTLNQLINDESITEEELAHIFKSHEESEGKNPEEKDHKTHSHKMTASDDETYLEIIEYDDNDK